MSTPSIEAHTHELVWSGGGVKLFFDLEAAADPDRALISDSIRYIRYRCKVPGCNYWEEKDFPTREEDYEQKQAADRR